MTDYLDEKEELRSFYTFSPSKAGILEAAERRADFPINHSLLVATLEKQYAGLRQHENVGRNISLLKEKNTYTICTAHQPNLLTGYLYFVYKILHAVKLAEELNKECPEKKFVPVYYMGSEDNDLDELGTFRYGGQKYVWDGAGQNGAVGRMNTKGLDVILGDLFKTMGPPGDHYNSLKEIISAAYLQHNTIAKATLYLVNELFGRFGLLVLDPDEVELKRSFIPVIKDELLHTTSFDIVSAVNAKLEENYKIQAAPRHINLFYLEDDLRERIERQGDKWRVVNTTISWTEEELLKEVEEHPERFSPNVILRGLYQETILPNVAFIGGGAEVAYWLQLKEVFTHYGVFYPNVQLRQSALWIGARESRMRRQLELGIADIFAAELELLKRYITANSSDEWQTAEEEKAMEAIMQQLKEKAAKVDVTLRASAEASLAKMRYQLQVLEKKMLRAEKRKMHVQLNRISNLKNALFPANGLQERVENFAGYYLQYGASYFDILKDAIKPFDALFLVVESCDDTQA